MSIRHKNVRMPGDKFQIISQAPIVRSTPMKNPKITGYSPVIVKYSAKKPKGGKLRRKTKKYHKKSKKRVRKCKKCRGTQKRR